MCIARSVQRGSAPFDYWNSRYVRHGSVLLYIWLSTLVSPTTATYRCASFEKGLYIVVLEDASIFVQVNIGLSGSYTADLYCVGPELTNLAVINR